VNMRAVDKIKIDRFTNSMNLSVARNCITSKRSDFISRFVGNCHADSHAMDSLICAEFTGFQTVPYNHSLAPRTTRAVFRSAPLSGGLIASSHQL
jgi:hypothetical protein